MKRSIHGRGLLIAGLLAVCGAVAAAPAPAGEAPEQVEAARKDFLDVVRVLQSPRCRNCHPAGDAPLHGDQGVPHTMNISRRSPEAGLACTGCHRERNAPVPGGPPGVPNWHMPPAEMPMIFEGKTPHELCVQLKDPAQNGGKELDELVAHVRDDKLVHWGWDPGPGRSKPPLPHAVFVQKVERWVAAGGPCPE